MVIFPFLESLFGVVDGDAGYRGRRVVVLLGP